MRASAALAVGAALLACACATQAQERAPAERQSLIDLSYSLGEAHALHRLCAGPRDNLWRGRMAGMIGLERPDEGLHRRLVEAFNAGYAARGAEFAHCGSRSRAAERDAAAHGRAIAQALARSRS